MTSSTADAQTEMMARLMRVAPDPERAARVRHACRAQLAGHQGAPRAIAERRGWGPGITVAVCALYAGVFMALALRVVTMFGDRG